MTVSYQSDVSSSETGGFTRLLLKWKGSLYKLIYQELVVFLILFGFFSFLYRHVLREDQQKVFERTAVYFDKYLSMIPLSFILGFFVTLIANRWWNQYMALPWPDRLLLTINLHLPGQDEEARLLRRNLMRYTIIMMILIFRSISAAVKRRFPTMEHLVHSGFMTQAELDCLNSVELEFNKYWIPSTWFINLLRDARRLNQIADPQGVKLIMEEFLEFRGRCGLLWSYDWVSVPLVYTQVVTISTYSFFIACLFGRQRVGNETDAKDIPVDIYLPVFTIFQFFFYMGLLKVAEQLINPYGEDDEDFELNFLIDRHTKVCFLGVDLLCELSPPISKDVFFGQANPVLPYTESSVGFKKKAHLGSAEGVSVPVSKQGLLLPTVTEEILKDDKSSVKNGVIPKRFSLEGGLPPLSSRFLRSRTFDEAQFADSYGDTLQKTNSCPSPSSWSHSPAKDESRQVRSADPHRGESAVTIVRYLRRLSTRRKPQQNWKRMLTPLDVTSSRPQTDPEKRRPFVLNVTSDEQRPLPNQLFTIAGYTNSAFSTPREERASDSIEQDSVVQV